MSLLLELSLSKDADLSDYKFEIPYYEWDGIKYPQGNAESKFFENCILQKTEDSFIRTYFPRSYQDEQLQEINIKADSLKSMFYLGSSDIEMHLSNIKQILISLTEKQDKWGVFFTTNYDSVPEIVQGNIDTVIDFLRLALVGTITDFIIYK